MTVIDVVILTWNDGHLLDAAIQSTLASRGVDVRLVVIDNGSFPLATIPADPRVTLVRNEENCGVAPARNQGVACGNAELVCLLDSDATLGPDSLATLAEAFEDPKVAVAVPVFSGQAPNATAGRAPTASVKLARALGRRDDYEPSEPVNPSGIWEVDFGIGACQMFRRSAFQEVGGLDDSIFYGPEDVDFCLRTRDAGYRVVQVAGAEVTHPPRRANRKAFTRAGLQHGYQVSRHLVRRRLVTGSTNTKAQLVIKDTTHIGGLSRTVTSSIVRSGKYVLLSAPIGRFIGWIFDDRIPFGGERISTASNAIAPSTKAQILFRLYERHELRFIRTLMRTDLDVVELGSSIGATGVAIRQRLGDGLKLVCVEANPELLETLEANVCKGSRKDRTTVEHGAVDYSGTNVVGLHLGSTTDGSRVGSGPVDSGEVVQVPVIKLGELLARRRIGNYVLVCDIEGSEAGLLQCEPEALDRCQQLLIELHDGEATIPELEAMILGLGFMLRAESKRAKVYYRP